MGTRQDRQEGRGTVSNVRGWSQVGTLESRGSTVCDCGRTTIVREVTRGTFTAEGPYGLIHEMVQSRREVVD